MGRVVSADPRGPRCAKRLFKTEAAAKVALVDITIKANRGGKTHGECRYYLCHRCKGWHLTSHPFDPSKRKHA